MTTPPNEQISTPRTDKMWRGIKNAIDSKDALFICESFCQLERELVVAKERVEHLEDINFKAVMEIASQLEPTHWLKQDYLKTKRQLDQSEQHRSRLVDAINQRINGELIYSYLNIQFPATIGHLPLAEFQVKQQEALSTQPPLTGVWITKEELEKQFCQCRMGTGKCFRCQQLEKLKGTK